MLQAMQYTLNVTCLPKNSPSKMWIGSLPVFVVCVPFDRILATLPAINGFSATISTTGRVMKRVCEMLLIESMQYYTVDVYLEYSDPIILEEDPVQQSIAKAFVCEVFLLCRYLNLIKSEF